MSEPSHLSVTSCRPDAPSLYTLLVMLTVRNVLDSPVVRRAQPALVGGADGLDGNVRWVHISDAADLTGLLAGRELVLTTGPVFGHRSQQIERYLRMLARLDVAGLVIELGSHVSSLPPSVHTLADELRLPIIALTHQVRFVDVTEQLHRQIVDAQYEEVRQARAAHEAFTSLNISRASPTTIVQKAAEILAAPLVLEDLNGHALAFGTAGQSAAALLAQWNSRPPRTERTGTQPKARRGSDGHHGPAPDSQTWMRVGVGDQTEQWAHLVLPASPADPSRARMVLERAAQSLQLHRMIERDRDALLVQALGGLLDDLLAGRITNESEAVARARSLGIAPGTAYLPLVLRFGADLHDDAISQGARNRRALAGVRQTIYAAEATCVASLRSERTVWLVVSCPPRIAPDKIVDRICLGLEDRLQEHGQTWQWLLGIAGTASSLIGAAMALADADRVAEVAITLPPGKRVYRSSDLRLHGLFSQLRGDRRVQAFASSELDELLRHDQRAGDNLVEVLRTYLREGGSKSDTARALGVSRPTLYARLAAIEHITKSRLDQLPALASLYAALLIVDAGTSPIVR